MRLADISGPYRRGSGRLTALLGLALLGGCGGIAPSVTLPAVAAPPNLPRGEPVTAVQRALSLDTLRAEARRDGRLADIAFRIATANAELCPDRAPISGLTLHTLAQYTPEARLLLAPDFPVAGPGVLAVASGSPADQAGLKPGDVLVSVAGRPFAPGKPGQRARYEDTEAASKTLEEGLTIGKPTPIVARRGAQTLNLILTPVEACAYDAQLAFAAYPGASADGRHVFITDEMVDYAARDDDLAAVVGHEYAHNLLHHSLKIDAANPARSILGAAPAAMRLAEREADYVGLYLTARAGYAVDTAPAFWARLAADFPSTPFTQLTHPDSRERVGAVQAALDEIKAKRAAGQALIPNWARP